MREGREVTTPLTGQPESKPSILLWDRSETLEVKCRLQQDYKQLALFNN